MRSIAGCVKKFLTTDTKYRVMNSMHYSRNEQPIIISVCSALSTRQSSEQLSNDASFFIETNELLRTTVCTIYQNNLYNAKWRDNKLQFHRTRRTTILASLIQQLIEVILIFALPLLTVSNREITINCPVFSSCYHKEKISNLSSLLQIKFRQYSSQ